MSNEFIPYSRQSIDQSDIEAVIEVLKSDWMTQGPKISEFEERLASRVDAEYAIALATGTAALHCACFAADVQPGDEIITSPITFAASGNCALYLGATVKFIDIKRDTYCLDAEQLEAAITSKTKAIIPVDYTGQPCDMDEINNIAQKHGVTVIEDAAHAIGARYKNKSVGSLTDMSIFSFHPVKHVAMGEGGLITTNNKNFADKLRLFRTHGITNSDAAMLNRELSRDRHIKGKSALNNDDKAPWYYEMHELGFNYRITDIQCALGISQLNKLDSFLERRQEIAERYTKAFSESSYIITPFQEPDRQNAWHLYMLRLNLDKMEKTRKTVFNELRAQGIGVHVHYIPLHLQPYYQKNLGYKYGDFPEAEAFYNAALTIPLYPAMTDKDVERVIETILDIIY